MIIFDPWNKTAQESGVVIFLLPDWQLRQSCVRVVPPEAPEVSSADLSCPSPAWPALLSYVLCSGHSPPLHHLSTTCCIRPENEALTESSWPDVINHQMRNVEFPRSGDPGVEPGEMRRLLLWFTETQS